MKVFVTGAAGFIGFHLTLALIDRDDEVIGIDNLNNYYDPALKISRLDEINKHPNSSNFKFNLFCKNWMISPLLTLFPQKPISVRR